MSGLTLWSASYLPLGGRAASDICTLTSQAADQDHESEWDKNLRPIRDAREDEDRNAGIDMHAPIMNIALRRERSWSGIKS